MPIYIFYNPANPKQQYMTTNYTDPGIPAGYLYSGGSDRAQPMPSQQYVAGVNSGGFPAYTGDASQVAANPAWPNGILR